MVKGGRSIPSDPTGVFKPLGGRFEFSPVGGYGELQRGNACKGTTLRLVDESFGSAVADAGHRGNHRIFLGWIGIARNGLGASGIQLRSVGAGHHRLPDTTRNTPSAGAARLRQQNTRTCHCCVWSDSGLFGNVAQIPDIITYGFIILIGGMVLVVAGTAKESGSGPVGCI